MEENKCRKDSTVKEQHSGERCDLEQGGVRGGGGFEK